MRFIVALLLAVLVSGRGMTAASSCASLSALAVPNATITLAQAVEAGPFMAPGQDAASSRTLPAFCRVAATLKPTADSEIKIEVWMPASGWNGKYQAVGNGAFNGSIAYPAMMTALARGYATSSTDTGHTGNNAAFAPGHPEKVIDFAWRAVHEMTLASKRIVAAYYDTAPKFSYWNGCSAGGRQAMKEAQRFPADFDGIIAGAPANYQMHLHVWSVAVAQAVHKEPGSYIPPEKYPAVHQAALEACDALDGLKDGLIQDPTRCHFDPQVLECKGADSSACLTAPQVEAARKIYAPVKNTRTGAEIFPGMEPGSELGWAGLAGPRAAAVATDTFTYIVYKDPNWDWHTLNPDADTALADKIDNGLIDAIDPNIEPFFSHKGKLIMYHGWSDQLIAPGNSVNYYGSVAKKMGSKSADEIRLFMVPGMAHCAGGEGPNTFDMVSALEQWVEQDHAPEQIIASHSQNGAVDRTRPLCPYPQVARYKGSGSIDEAANFTCAAP